MKRILKILILLSIVVSISQAAIQRHDFTLAGDGGETGSGFFTWDDIVTPDGNQLTFVNIQSMSLTINGGNVAGAGSTVTFTKAECTDALLHITPTFLTDINFQCTDGTDSITPTIFYNADLNLATSIITFTPGANAPISPLAYIVLALGVLFIGVRQSRSVGVN